MDSSQPHARPDRPNAPEPVLAEADALVAALSRMRGRRGPRLPRGEQAAEGERHEREPGDGHPGHDPRGPGPRGRGDRFGGPAQLRLLSVLSHAAAPLTVSDLAEQIGVDQPRASRLVQQSIERGFAAREADPSDARRTLVRLTPAGEQAVHGFRDRQREDASTALAALSPAERTELVRLLSRLAEAWPEPERRGPAPAKVGNSQ